MDNIFDASLTPVLYAKALTGW